MSRRYARQLTRNNGVSFDPGAQGQGRILRDDRFGQKDTNIHPCKLNQSIRIREKNQVTRDSLRFEDLTVPTWDQSGLLDAHRNRVSFNKREICSQGLSTQWTRSGTFLHPTEGPQGRT